MGNMLKNKDIWAMNPKDREAKIEELRNELMHQRGTAAMGGAMRSPGLVRSTRTSIARLLTIQNQVSMREAVKLEKKAREERAVAARVQEKKNIEKKKSLKPGKQGSPKLSAPAKEAKRK